MVWTIELDLKVEKDLRKLSSKDQIKVISYIKNNIASLQNPRSIGSPLKGSFGGLWRYRCGNYRIIAKIEDPKLIILIVKIGHRKNIYKN